MKLKPKSDFKRNVITLLTGTTIAQIIPIAVSPILTRLYSPEDFGVLALFTSLVTIVGIISTGLYESAIVLPKRKKDAVNILGLCHIIVFSFSLILFPILWFGESIIANFINDEAILDWLYFIPLATLFMGLIQTYTNWSIRNSSYKRLATNRIAQNITLAATNVSAGFLGFGVSGLIAGFFGSQLVSSVLLFLKVKFEDSINLKSISWERIKLNAHRYQDFPKINLFQVLVDTLQASLIVFSIKGIWGVAILGLYAFMMRILRAPLNIIGSSISQVFYQKASQAFNNKENLFSILLKTMLTLALLGVVPFTILLFFAPELFSFAFGQEWQEAGVYAQLLTPWLFFNFIYSPLSQVPLILNKQKKSFVLGLIYNLIIFGIIYFMGANGFSPHTTFITLSIAISIYLVFMLMWLLSITKYSNTN